MKYVVYEQRAPINSKRKDKFGYPIIEADVVEIGTINIPVNVCPIEYVREQYGIKFPLVSAVNGYTEDGKVRPYLQ